MRAVAIFLMFICRIAAAGDPYRDTLWIGSGPDQARKESLAWASRFKSEKLMDDKVVSADSLQEFKSMFRLKSMGLVSAFEIRSAGKDSSRIVLELKSLSGIRLPEKLSNSLHENLLASIRESHGEQVEGTHEYGNKSRLLYLGLSIINTGAGFAYADYHSFVFQPAPILVVGAGLIDAASLAAMFSGDGTIRTTGIVMFSIYKALGLLGIANIGLHNEFSESGYKYHF